MFDATTEKLIASAPPLPDVPEHGIERVAPEHLARELTRAYAEIAVQRLHLATLPPSPSTTEEFAGIVRRLRRLASTYEGMVCLKKGEPDRAAAFVAGIARQVIFEAESSRLDAPRLSFIGYEAISFDIAAMLLFLAAEAHPDAAAPADGLTTEGSSSIRSAWITAWSSATP